MQISDEEDDDEPGEPRTQRGRSSVIASDEERFDDDNDEQCDPQGSDGDASPALERSDSENDIDAHGIGAGGSSSGGGGAPLLVEPGAVMMHKQKGMVKIVRLGIPSDFFNANRVYISYQKTLPGCKKKMATHHAWIDVASLEGPPARSDEDISDDDAAGVDREPSLQEGAQQRQQRPQLPARAAHERERTLPVKKPAPKRGRQEATRVTKSSKVSLDERLREFQGHTLMISGNKLFCKGCGKAVENKHSTIRSHVTGKYHKHAISLAKSRMDDDNELKVCAAACHTIVIESGFVMH